MNYKVITNTIGWVLKTEGACMLLPLICAAIYGEWNSFNIFLVCILLCMTVGIVLSIKAPHNRSMYARDGFVTVALSWIMLSIFGAFPFVFSGAVPNFVDALFETASGFTTTGASILTDVEVLSKSLLFWRSFTHWLGGMGVLVFIVAILPLSGSDNFFLMKAESPGPSVSKLVPKVKSTAKILYGIYISFTLLEIILLLIAKMNLFDALTLSFGTAGTGGFAIKNSGLADYTSIQQIIITVFMIIFGVDFSFYYLILIRKFKSALSLEEPKVYIGIIIASIALICINCADTFATVGEAVRHSAFQVGSIITTTGYSTVDFDAWPQLSKTILLVLMFIGACAGSTGGGIKVSRILIYVKSIIKEIRITVHPKSTIKSTLNGRMIAHETVRASNVFLISYLIIFVISLLVISIDNFDFTTNFSAVAATINNIGPGFSLVGPTRNFSLFSNLSTIVLTLDMIIGRLEIFPILVLFAPSTWRK